MKSLSRNSNTFIARYYFALGSIVRRLTRRAPGVALRAGALVLAFFATFGFNPQALAATYEKTSTSGALSTASAAIWTPIVGGVSGNAPGAADIALFDANTGAAQSDTLGNNLTLGEIQITNPAGAITVAGDSSLETLTLNGVASSLGFNVGIDMSLASVGLNYGGANDALTVGSTSQNWWVASGQSLAISGAVAGSGNLTIGSGSANSAGSVTLQTTADTFSGNYILNNGVTLNANIGQATTAGFYLNGSTLTTSNALAATNFIYADSGSSTFTSTAATNALLSGNGNVKFTITNTTAVPVGLFSGLGGVATEGNANGFRFQTGNNAVTDAEFATLNFGATGGNIYERNVGTTYVLGGIESSANASGQGIWGPSASTNTSDTFDVGSANLSTTYYGWARNQDTSVVNFVKVGTGTLSLAGNTAWQNGMDQIASSGAEGSVSLNGGIFVDNEANLSTGLLSSSSLLNFGGGTLEVIGASSGVSTQSQFNTTLTGGGGRNLIVDPNGGTSTTLNLGQIVATAAGGTLNIEPTTYTYGTGIGSVTTPTLKGADGTFGPRLTYGNDWLAGGGTSNTNVSWTTSVINLAGQTNGNEVDFTGTAPGGLTAGTTYYVVNATGTTFQVALAPAGTPGANSTAITLTNTGSTATVNTPGALTSYTGYNVLAAGYAGGTDTTDDQINTATTGNVSLTANYTTNLLDIKTTATQTLSLNGHTLQVTAGGLLFAGTAPYTIGFAVNDGTLRSFTATNSDLIIQDLGTGGLTINSVIANGNGVSTLTVAGSGTLTLNGANTYTGSTFLNRGTVVVTAANNLGAPAAASSVTLNGGILMANATFTLAGGSSGGIKIGGGGGTFNVAAGSNLTISGIISDEVANQFGPLTKTGQGTLTLTAANTYNGATIISGGIVSVNTLTTEGQGGIGTTASSLGEPDNAAPGLVLDSGTLQYTGGTASTDRTFTVTQNGGEIDANGTGALTFTNILSGIYSGTGNRTLTFGGTNTGANTFAGLIIDASSSTGSGTTGVTKSGAGQWVLSYANNTFTGPVNVQGGTLALSAPNSNNISHTGSINIASGATLNTSLLTNSTLILASGQLLTGAGTLAGTLSAGSGTVVAPGNGTASLGGTGVLTLGNLTVGTGAIFNFGMSSSNIDGALVGASDNLVSTGGLTLTGTASVNLYAQGTSSRFFLATGGQGATATYDLFKYTGTLTGSPAADFVVNSSTINPAYSYTFGTNNGYVTVTILQTGASTVWTADANGNWSNSANWNGGVPQHAGDTATFGSSITAPRTVTLDTPETVAQLTFDSANSYTISGANTLTLDAGGAGASINVASGTHFISIPIALNDNLSLGAAASSVLNISGTISNVSASKTVTFAGPGTVVLSASNNYGPAASGTVGTIMNGGTVQVQNNSALGAGDISVTGNSTLQSGTAGLTVANNIIIGGGVTSTFDDQGNTLILSGTISQAAISGQVVETGSGSVILTSNEGYTGSTTINQGTLQLGNGNSAGSVAGSIVDNATLESDRSDNYSLGNVISGSGGFIQAGPDNVTLTGSNSYAGNTVVSNGTLTLGNVNAISGSTLNYNNQGGTLSFGTLTTANFGGLSGSQSLPLLNTSSAPVALVIGADNQSTTYSGGLSGAGGSLTFGGQGALALTGSNSYTGATSLNNGTLSLGPGGVINGGAININAGLFLVNGGSLTASAAGVINIGAEFDMTSGSATFNGGIGNNNAGDGALIEVDGGTFTTTTINLNRTAIATAPTAAYIPGSSPQNGFVVTGGTANFANLNIGIGNTDLSSSASYFGGGVTTATGLILVGFEGNNRWNYMQIAGGSVTDLGTVAGTSGLEIGKAGTSIQSEVYTTGGVGTFGVISFGNPADTVGGTANLVMNGGSLYVGSGGIVKSGTAALTTNVVLDSGTLGAIAPWSSSLPIILNATTTTPTIQTADSLGNANNISLTGAISGPGGLIVSGSGTLTLSAANSYTGITTLNSGTLDINGEFALGGSVYGGFTFNGGTLQYAPAFAGNGNGDITQNSLNAAKLVTINAGGATIDNGGNVITYADPFGNNGSGGLTLLGSGELILGGSGSYTGPTVVTTGTLQLGSGGTTGSLSPSSNITDDSTLIINRSNTVTQGVDLSNVIAGPGGLTQAGTGTTILSSSNTFTGPIAVTAGTLKLAAGTATTNSSITVAHGGTLGFSGGTVGIGASGISLAGGSTLSLVNAAGLPVTVTSTVGTNTSTVLTIGDSTSNPVNFLFGITATGATTLNIANGVVSFGTGGAMVSITDLDNMTPLSSYTLISEPNGSLIPADFTLAGGGTVPAGGQVYRLTLAGSTNTSIVVSLTAVPSDYYWTGNTSASWSNLSNFATDHTGATAQTVAVNAGSNVYLTADIAATNANNTPTETLDGNYSINSLNFTGAGYAGVSGTSGIVLSAGTGTALTLVAQNTFKDANNIIYPVGTGLVVQAGSLANTISANINLGNNQIWEIDNSAAAPLTVSGVIADGSTLDSLTKIGAGTLILQNSNTYDGGTIVSGGTLMLGTANALLTTGTVTVSGSGTLDLAGNAQQVGGLSDGGVNTGIITSSASPATLTVANATNNTFSGAINGNVSLAFNGPANVTLSGSNHYEGSTMVTSGTLTASNNNSLGDSTSASGGLSIVSGATVNFTSASPSIAGLSAPAGAFIVLGGTTGTGTPTTLNFTGAGNGLIVSAVISDRTAGLPLAVGNLTISGGTLLLNGANTFTGATNVITGGALEIGTALALQDSTLNLSDLTGSVSSISSTVTLAGLTGIQGFPLTTTNSGAIALTIGNNNITSIYAGNLSGLGSLNKVGTGSFTVGSNANGGGGATYAGNTTISAGTLVIGGTSSLGGTIDLTSSIATTVFQSNLIVQDNAVINATGRLTLASNDGGNANNYPGASTVIFKNNSNSTFPAIAFGSGGRLPTGNSITIQDNASVTVNGSIDLRNSEGSTVGGSVINLNGGTLAVQRFILTGGGGGTSTETLHLNGGTLMALANDPSASTFLPVLGGLTADVDAGGAIINTGTNSITFSQVLVDGSHVAATTHDGGLTKNGTGTLFLIAADSFNGGATLNAGILNINGEFALGGAVYGGLTFNGGTLQYASTIPGTNGTTDITQKSAATPVQEPVTISAGGATIDTNGNNVTYAYPLGNNGTGGLTKVGVGNLTLNGAQSYTGTTTVNVGKITLASGSSYTNPTAAFVVNSGASLAMASGNTFSTASPAFTVNSGGTLALQGDTIGTTSAGITVNGGGVYTQQNGAVDTVTLNSAGAGTGTVLTVGDSNAAGNFYFDINSTTSDELILNNGIAAFGAKGGKIFVDDLDTNPLTGPYTLISSPNGGLATGSGGGAFFQLGTLSLVVNGTTYGLSLSTSTANAEILTASVLSVATYYWTGGTSGSWSVPGNFATDQLGATPETQVPGVSNSVFLTANSASNLSNMTLDGNYTVNSLAFTGTNTAATTAATSPITLAAGNNSSNTITINALSGFSDNVGNTYSGGVGLVVQPGSAQHTISANVQLGSNQTWEIDNAPSNGLIVSGTIGDAGSGFGISKTGLGTLIIAGAATYSGTTAITSGTVQLGNGVAGGGTLSGPVLNNSALVLDRPDDYTLSTNMAGTGNLTQVGGDNVTLTGTNTFTGVTVIAAGSLITGVPQALEGTVVNYNNQGGTLSFGTLTAATLGGLSGSQNLALLNTNAAGVALSVGFGSQNSAYFGALSDGGSGAPGALTKIGTGTFALNGANTYDGPTTISAGTLQISAANNLGDASANNTIIFTGGTLESTANSYDLGATRSVLLTGTGTFQVDTGSALTVSGVVSGGGGIGKTGTGTLILTSPNTYSGVTTINAGALNVQTATALGGTANGTIVNAGGALQLQGGITIATEALTLNGTGVGNTGALRNVSGANSYTGPVTLASAARINSDSGTLTVATIGGAFPLTIGGLGNTTVTGAITTGANLVTLDGAGIVTFSGANTFTGNIVVNGGELIANEGNGSTGVVATSLGDADTAGRSVTVTNGTLVFAVPNVTGGGSQSAPANYTAFSLTNSTWNFTAAGGNATVGAVTLNGSTINIQNTGSQALYEAIGFAGSVTVSGTASAITGLGGAFEGANLGIGNPVAAGYQTTFTVGNTVNGTASGGTAPDLTVGIPLVNGNNNAVAVSTGLILNGPGTLLLTATNTYTGPTTINSGTLQLGNGTAGNDGTIANSSGITDNGALVYNRSGALSSGVLISGNGSVTISGSGSQTLTAANTYTGPTTITSGATLQLGNGTAGNDGTIQGSSGITDNGTLIYDRFNVLSSAVAISGTGAVTVTGAGTQYLTAVNSYSGLTTINSGATLELGNGSSGSDGTILNTSGITDNGTLVYNRFGNLSSSIVISGNGGVTVSGPGSQTLTAANSYSGTTIINSGGTLQLGDGTAGHDGTILNTSGITDNGTLIYNRSGALSSGIVIAGAGAVKVSGTGSQTLTAANTYTGATTINSGATLQLGNGTSGNDGTIASSSGITDNGSLIYNRSGALSSGVAITGAGSVIKTGTGTQTLSSTGDSYSGGTTISQGTLIVTGSLSGAGAVNLNAGVLGGGGSITGALTVATNATVYPGTGLNSAGTKLTLANSVVFGASSSLTINLNPTAGTSDTLAVGGALTLDPGNTDILTLNLLNVPATVGPGTYIIATYNSSSPLTGTFGSVVQNGGNLGAYSVNYNVPGGANIDEITVTVVPEPGTWASLIAGFGILIAFQNRRRRRNG